MKKEICECKHRKRHHYLRNDACGYFFGSIRCQCNHYKQENKFIGKLKDAIKNISTRSAE